MNTEFPIDFIYPDSEYARKFELDYRTNSGRKLVYGQNIYSNSIIKNYAVDAIVDDYSNQNGDIPVIRTNEIKPEDMVIVCSGGKVLTAIRQVQNTKAQWIDYFHFLEYSELNLAKIRFNYGFREAFQENESKFKTVFNKLEDDESKMIFRKLVSFRNTNNVNYLEGFEDKQRSMYFEDFLKFNDNEEVFYDIGAFDGENSDHFAIKCPNYSEINMFEPDENNMQKLRIKYKSKRAVNLHGYGLSNVRFKSGFASAGPNSRIDEGSASKADFLALDDLEQNISPPTFMKMDIEGGEKTALQGSSNTIAKNSPKLAISVYHEINDFWEIPTMILSFNPNYKIRFRHYTESIYETVAFFSL